MRAKHIKSGIARRKQRNLEIPEELLEEVAFIDSKLQEVAPELVTREEQATTQPEAQEEEGGGPSRIQ